jgi:hypothetical protein
MGMAFGWIAPTSALDAAHLGVGRYGDRSITLHGLRCSGQSPVSHYRPAPLEASLIIDVHAATITGLAFKPSVHLNYAETVLPMSRVPLDQCYRAIRTAILRASQVHTRAANRQSIVVATSAQCLAPG